MEQLVAEYVVFYNFKQISLKNGLTPVEIRCKTAYIYEILRQPLIFASVTWKTVHFFPLSVGREQSKAPDVLLQFGQVLLLKSTAFFLDKDQKDSFNISL